MKRLRGCFRLGCLGVIGLLILGGVGYLLNPTTPTPRPASQRTVEPTRIAQAAATNTPRSTAAASARPRATNVPRTNTPAPSAIPTKELEAATVRAALADRSDVIDVVVNDLVDKNVIVTVLSSSRDKDVNTDLALLILRKVAPILPELDLPLIIINVRNGTVDLSVTSINIRAAKQDVIDFAAGRITKAKLLERQVP